MRGINERFVEDLKVGCLSWFLQQVKERTELALAIRQDYINIYYRGGNALRIKQRKNGYRFEFDEKYCIDESGHPAEEKRTQIRFFQSPEDYREHFDLLLSEMDNWFYRHPKAEREIQHELIRHNSSGFCILDIEYAGNCSSGSGRCSFRLDMVAVNNGKLVIVENKCGVAAMGGTSGVAAHYRDICAILADNESKRALIDSLKNISENKKALGLPSADVFGKEDIELLFLVFHSNGRSKMLANELEKMHGNLMAKIIYMDAPGGIPYNNAEVLI